MADTSVHKTMSFFKKPLIVLGLLWICLPVTASFNGFTAGKLRVDYVKRSPGTQVRTVVIDAGHGGKDPGCHGNFAHEKDICLAISLKLGKLIEEHFSDVKVIYTRKTDVFVELHNRAKIANDNDADLFICIHVNAGGDGKAYGSETYVMGLHRSETNLSVAKRENSVIEYEEDYKKQYEGFDPNSAEGSIIFSLYQNRYLNQSLSFAAKVQDKFRQYAGRHDRGVRQAGFLVLVYTTMPAVLIETGFATHPDEEKFLADKNGQTIMAESIFQGFIDYKKEIERDGYKGMVKEFRPTDKDAYKPSKDEVKQDPPKENGVVEPVNGSGDVVFRVQFMTSSSLISTDSDKFRGIEVVSVQQQDGIYKYMAGNEKDFNKASSLQTELRGKGYKDAFMVAFQGNRRIPVKEALDILQKNN
jgi:N-acetylmuramoyl-L-alanine amidase